MANQISIIVPCYNSAETIKKCISHIQQSLQNYDDNIDYKLIVVNDGSQDNTANILKTIDGITVITHEKNRGLSCARNSGIKNQDSEYLVFIDSDIFVLPDWFTIMLNYIKQNSNVIGVTGNLLLPKGKNDSPLDSYLFSSYRGAKNIDNNVPLSYKWFVFSNTIIKTSILQSIDFFDETLEKYGGEDTEMAIRINNKYPDAMRKINKALAYHYANKTLTQYLNNMFEYGKYNFPKIIKKHPNYKNDLGHKMIGSIWGYFLFNPCSRFKVRILQKMFQHPLLTKFLVIDSFIKGAREGLEN